jgi:hypothetical protein
MKKEIYKGYQISKNEFGYFEAYNTNDCDQPMVNGKTIQEVKGMIDLISGT